MARITRRELLAAVPVVAAAARAQAKTTCATERWAYVLKLKVPRIYDNSSSRGYRKYQWQKLRGTFAVQRYAESEPDVVFYTMENETHKVNGRRVTYSVEPSGTVLWHGIGSNRAGVFRTRSVVLEVEAMPSYAIGPVPSEDNSLLVVLSGMGNSAGNLIQGYAAGQLGCGCYEYGHTSPTRIWGTDHVVDTAAVFGTWRARRVA